MSQKKIDEKVSGIPNVFGIVDDILIAGFDEWGKDHNETLKKVCAVCREANLKLNKDKCPFRYTSIPICGEIISWQGVSPDPRKAEAQTNLLPLKIKKELQSFLNILNDLSKFSPMTVEVFGPLQKVTSVKTNGHGTMCTKICTLKQWGQSTKGACKKFLWCNQTTVT